jgi:glycosyltransferase involved in cell wall biosynthesis
LKFSKVSVIIPVYNAEKYLYRCLNSAICQTLKDIEIIIVNDASTDNSLQIIQEFQAVYLKLSLNNLGG